jgi:hypothetical protein
MFLVGGLGLKAMERIPVEEEEKSSVYSISCVLNWEFIIFNAWLSENLKFYKLFIERFSQIYVNTLKLPRFAESLTKREH